MSDYKEHFQYLCRYCRHVGYQCKCPGAERKIRWNACRSCEAKLARGEKLTPLPEAK